MRSQASPGSTGWSNVQQDWESPLHGPEWGQGPDNRFLIRRIWNLPADVAQRCGGSTVLDIAAAQAVHSADIASRGFTCTALEPAPTMLAAARQRIRESGANVHLVQGFAEDLPFRAGSFDQVLCHSAVDHFAEPDRCIREMTRVLRPAGSLVLTFVNYASVSTRISRFLYGIADRARPRTRIKPWFWESPVGLEHSFECTLPVLTEMCEQYLTLEEAFGVSIGWQTPGWGWLLERTPRAAEPILSRLDRLAQRFPTAADLVVAIWRPRPRREWRASVPVFKPSVIDNAEVGTLQVESLRVTGADPVYRRLSRLDVEPRRGWADLPVFTEILDGYYRMSNRQVTGDPERSWLDDLIGRDCAGRTAILGIDSAAELVKWQRSRDGQRTDVFDLSPDVIEKCRRVLAAEGLGDQVRFFQADLNFLRLPARSYGVVWSSGCLHHVVNLESLFGQVGHALSEDGVFAIYDYVGELRRQFHPRRLERINALFQSIPPSFRRGESGVLEAQPAEQLRPFCAARSLEIWPLARERFDPVHEVVAGHFHPIEMYLDVARIEAEEPALIDRLLEAESSARRDEDHAPCILYGVYRRGDQRSERT